MSRFIQYKYIMEISQYLEGFKQVANTAYNFRCPLCGDSKQNRNKRRGYLLLNGDEPLFYCHNCGVSKNLGGLLYELKPELYKEYKKELTYKKLGLVTKKEEPVSDLDFLKQVSEKIKKKYIRSTDQSLLQRLDTTNSDHPARVYLERRKVPVTALEGIYWTSDFQTIIRNEFGDKYDPSTLPNTGIVFRLHNLDNPNEISGYQIRSIDENVPKAKRFKICKADTGRIGYSVHPINNGNQVYVTEGCIDSLFLPNCVAMLNASLWKASLPDAVYINDCEPRNPNIVGAIKKVIDMGYRVVLLPHEYEGFDINDIVIKFGLSESELIDLIQSYTYSGLRAKVEFSNWSKC